MYSRSGYQFIRWIRPEILQMEKDMGKSFTPEQQKVIELRDRNILVSAAAGSGKTTVLVERIIQRITDEKRPADIDRLLVVTFTNAAAAEMRERISQAVNNRLMDDPHNIHLQKQASLLHNAQITTIDSFCLFIIRNNFNDIGLDPGFRVADEGELRLLKQDVMREFLEEKYQKGEETFVDCVEYFTGGSNDRLLEEYISRIYEFSMSFPWPEDWISQCGEGYEIKDVMEMENTSWCRELLKYIRNILTECRNSMENALQIAERPDGPYMYGEMLEREAEMLNQLLTAEGLWELYGAFDKITFGRLSSRKDPSVDPLWREQVKKIRDKVKKQLEEVRISYLAISPDQMLKRMQKAAPAVKELLQLVLDYGERLAERKKRDNVIDFGDMEHFALNILLKKEEDGSVSPTPAAREYRQFFQEILIDEYQDSNLVQELLLKSISGEEEGNFNRFMVGDVKQSIYKFRLARPELFMEKYNCYSKGDSLCQRIDLHRNFRSRRQVVDSVNDLFSQIMGQELGGVEYDEEAALYPGAEYPDPEEGAACYETEYLLIGKNEDLPLTAREQEALAIARRIRELYQNLKVTDPVSKELRPVKYSDMVVLLRTTTGWAEEFRRILEKENIPAYVSSRTGYFQAAEVRTLLQFLQVIDNPLQDIPLYGTLKSFFGGFSDEEIAFLRGMDTEQEEPGDRKTAKKKKILLYYLLTTHEGKLKEKIQVFLKRLNTYRQKTAYTPIHKLIQEILADSGYLEYVLASPGGGQRRANVEMLLTRAAAFESTSYYGLFHFLRYIEQLEKYEVDYGLADIMDENADVVRIMSIHKSKGLEFPVCFVAGLSKRFNMQDVNGRLIADVDMGIGADYVDSSLRIQSHTLKKQAVALKMRLDALGEEMRVLYVAMTRAKEKLILSATVDDPEKFWQETEMQRKKISFSVLAGARSYLDFVAPCLEKATLLPPEEGFVRDVKDAVAQIERSQKLFAEKIVEGEMTERDNRALAELSKRLEASYPCQYLSDLFIKTTVSELKKKAIHDLPMKSIEALASEPEPEQAGAGEQAFTRTLFPEPEIIPYIPSFIEAKETMTGTDRGSAYHKAMELFDFQSVAGKEGEKEKREEISRQLEQFESMGMISRQWKEGISLSRLMTFFRSRLAQRMGRAAQAGTLQREKPFVLGISAGRLGGQFPDSEQVLIQGIIDVFFEEDGKMIVADYKTDAVKTPEELIGRYQIQLDYYAEALGRLTGREVTEKIIYSFALGKEIMLY